MFETKASSLNFLVVVFTLIVSTSNSESIGIHNANDLISFSNEVNSGNTYSGTTVYLDSDIEFDPSLSELFTSIGITSSCYFNGIFDGQGHIISNLNLTSSSQHVGLFGYSTGTTIKNVVIDKSCTIISFYSSISDDLYIGSVIGQCYSSNNPCTIANVVNMGNVSFGESVQRNIYIGGIAGYFEASNTYPTSIINCANYGTVISTGSAYYSEAGGIVGFSKGHSPSINCNVQNSVNHGNVLNQGSTTLSYAGGIVGLIEKYSLIENCVNTGEQIHSRSGMNGGFVGFLNYTYNITIIHCLSSGSYYYRGGISSALSNSLIIIDSSTSVTFNTTILNELNEHFTRNEFNKWILNPDNNEVSFNINGEKVFSITSQLILLPDLDGDSEHTFSGWFNDSSCTNKFNSDEIISDTTLYGGWSYTVTFDFNNGTTLNEIVVYGKEINFPEDAEREGYTFNGWNNSGITRIPGHDITFTANWTEVVQTRYVEIVFSKKDLSEEEIKEIINKYVDNADYEMKITKFDDVTTTVIIKFVDVEAASEFVRKINSAGSDITFIKRISFTSTNYISYSLISLPLSILFYTII